MANRTSGAIKSENETWLLKDVVAEGQKPAGEGAALAVLDIPDRHRSIIDLPWCAIWIFT